MDTPSLWACCILPGCKQPVAEELDVCSTCRTAFGDYLREIDREPSYTVTDIADRDAEINAMYRSLRRCSAAAEIDTTSHDYRTAVAITRTVAQNAGREEKANQRCWLCEQPRKCLLEPGGWECRECRQIR